MSDRDLDSALAAALSGATLYPVFFYQGEFTTGVLRLWTGVESFSWNGHTWTGAGNLFGISAVREASGIEAVNMTVSLQGPISALVSAALSESRNGLPGTVWFGLLTAAGALIADPFESFTGRLDRPDIMDDGTNATISMAYESRLIDLLRPRVRRMTHEDQQLRSPGDKGFEYVPSLQDALILLGKF